MEKKLVNEGSLMPWLVGVQGLWSYGSETETVPPSVAVGENSRVVFVFVHAVAM